MWITAGAWWWLLACRLQHHSAAQLFQQHPQGVGGGRHCGRRQRIPAVLQDLCAHVHGQHCNGDAVLRYQPLERVLLVPDASHRPYQQPLQVYLRQLIENYQKLYDESPVVLSYSADSLAYAIIICSIIPVLAIYPYIQKYFAKGVNMGGVKG